MTEKNTEDLILEPLRAMQARLDSLEVHQGGGVEIAAPGASEPVLQASLARPSVLTLSDDRPSGDQLWHTEVDFSVPDMPS